MTYSIGSLFRGLIACAILLTIGSAAVQAQTKASCTFKVFTLPNSNPKGDFALGINSYGTVVGEFENTNGTEIGFIRYSGGHLNFFAPGGAAAWFTARNDAGISIGEELSNVAQGFMLHGSSGVTPIIHPKAVMGTFVQGINRWNSVVGYYLDANNVPHGFKFLSNGTFIDINFPGAQRTTPMGINDSGMIVGSYIDVFGSHGFIYHSGKWATLDNPAAPVGTTGLNGISNAGKIIGFNSTQPKPTTFLYENGAFKVIAVPNASGGTFANGISANGLITGDAYLNSNSSSQKNFIATCK
jgi:hypothetical protein